MRRSRTSIAAPGLALLVAIHAAWLIGQVWRDVSAIPALLFYIPSPLLLALDAGACLALFSRRRLRSALMAGGLMLLPAFGVIILENRWTPPAAAFAAGELRLVHWNVFWGKHGWNGILEEIAAERPDIVVVSETPLGLRPEQAAERLGGDFEGRREGTLGLLVRGRIARTSWAVNTEELKILEADCILRGDTLRIFMVDLPSSLRYTRDPILSRLREQMALRRPDIVVGDLNSPRRSRALSPPPSGYVHAYEEVGSGWSYTWPAPLPFLAIDQCLAGERIQPTKYLLRGSLRSDHARQVLTFALTDGGR